MIVTIDPGATVGFAEWINGTLKNAGSTKLDLFIRAFAWGRSVHGVIEMPDHFAVKTQDVLTCAFRAGQIASLFGSFETLRVGEWKGSVPKRVTERRVKRILTLEELDKIGKNDTHSIDAIGIGLVYFGRMQR